jgi:hypothetical protein
MMSRCAWAEHCVSVELTQDVKAALPIQPMPLATRTAARMRRASCMSGETTAGDDDEKNGWIKGEERCRI